MSHLHDDPLYQKALDRLEDRCEEKPHELFPHIENNVNDLAIAGLFSSDADWVVKLRDRAIREYQDKHVGEMVAELRQEEADYRRDCAIDDARQA